MKATSDGSAGNASTSGSYILLIGLDTRFKRKYVRWEAEVAIEKKCRIIGVNLHGWRRINAETCPAVIRDIGAMFVPFSPQIVAHALDEAKRHDDKNWRFNDATYTKLGYVLSGDRAVWSGFTFLRKQRPSHVSARDTVNKDREQSPLLAKVDFGREHGRNRRN